MLFPQKPMLNPIQPMTRPGEPKADDFAGSALELRQHVHNAEAHQMSPDLRSPLPSALCKIGYSFTRECGASATSRPQVRYSTVARLRKVGNHSAVDFDDEAVARGCMRVAFGSSEFAIMFQSAQLIWGGER